MAAPAKLTLEQRVLQLVFPGFRFGSDDPAAAERLAAMGVGGFCLYGGEKSEVAAFTRRLQETAEIPLLFCGDYEEGTASHVAGGTRLPPNMAIGASGRADLARRKAQLTAVEARAMGVRWVLAPVLDLATLPLNPIVNLRSFGADPEAAAKMGKAYMRGLKDMGVLSCAKHFPGHGETRQDSHLELPVLALDKRTLLRRELVPFMRTKSAADSVMVAHLRIPALGAAKVPASLSRDVVGGLLRKTLRFSRLTVTDALSMKAIADHYGDEEACLLALRAGVDVFLVPTDALGLVRTLPGKVEADPALRRMAAASYKRLVQAKKACGLWRDKGLAPEADLDLVGCSAHQAEARRMASACLAWVRRKSTLSGKKRVVYVEPDAESPGDWKGGAFIEELKSFGIEAEPAASSEGEPAVVASFLRPRAYSGRISFSDEEVRRARASLSAPRDSFLVSFGSPFVFDQLKGWDTGLCAFSDADAAQRAAAWALSGRLEARGSMPVSLESAAIARRARATRRAGARRAPANDGIHPSSSTRQPRRLRSQ